MHLGSGKYKARWVTIGAVVMGLGSFTMALPHFTTGLYEWGQEFAGDTCYAGESRDVILSVARLGSWNTSPYI